MKFYRDLLDRAGLAGKTWQGSAVLLSSSLMVFVVAELATNVPGFAFSLAGLTMLFLVEVIRLRGKSRQERMARSYPALFDAMGQAVSSGVSLEQQIGQLALAGPVDLRISFQKLNQEILAGHPLDEALNNFQIQSSNRHADLFCKLVLIGLESGQSGQKQNWKSLATRTREEQGSIGLVMAKQDWVLGSAKVALLSPWLIAALLMQLPQNKEAFSSQIGSVVLVLGLALSVFAYFLVNQLGSIPVQPRIFHAAR